MSLKMLIPVFHIRKLPPLLFASMGALIGLLVTTFVLTERAGQKNLELVKDFGETVVAMAAREVVDAAVNDDLVSMHAVMQALVAQPRVKMATVHNLQQQLLVQAGQVKNNVDYQVFSAPIALHDSIEGHVSIAVESSFPGDAAVRWTLTGTAFLLSIMILLTLYETRGYAWHFRPAEKRNKSPAREQHEQNDEEPQAFAEDEISVDDPESIEVSDDGNVLADQEQSSNEPLMPDAGPAEEGGEAKAFYSDLILALPNFPRLQQQLNSERFEQLIHVFDLALDEVLSLYGGQRVGPPHNGHVYCIRFASGESVSEGAFRAACSAHLIYQLTQTHKIRFTLLVEICHPEEDVKLAVSQTGIYLQGPLIDELLRKRLILDELADGRFQLSGFNAPFASLLERQQQQLSLYVPA